MAEYIDADVPEGEEKPSPLGALRHDLFRPGRHRAVLPDHAGHRHHPGGHQAAGRDLQAPRLRVPGHAVRGPHPRHPRRAHDVRHEVRQLGVGPQARPDAHGAGARGGRHGRHLAARWARTPASTRSSSSTCARSWALRPTRCPPRCLRATATPRSWPALAVTASTLRVHRHAGAPAAAVRRHRGGGAVREGPEGLIAPCPTSATPSRPSASAAWPAW